VWFDIDSLFLRDLTPLLPVGGSRDRATRDTLAHVEFFAFPPTHTKPQGGGCGDAFYLKRGSNAAQRMMKAMQDLIRQLPTDSDEAANERKADNGRRKPLLESVCGSMLTHEPTARPRTAAAYPSCFFAEAGHKEVMAKAHKSALYSFAVVFPKRTQDAGDPTSTAMSEKDIELAESASLAFVEYRHFIEWQFEQLARNGKLPLAAPIVQEDEDEIAESCVSAIDER
jgi:hypothetical protein